MAGREERGASLAVTAAGEGHLQDERKQGHLSASRPCGSAMLHRRFCASENIVRLLGVTKRYERNKDACQGRDHAVLHCAVQGTNTGFNLS